MKFNVWHVHPHEGAIQSCVSAENREVAVARVGRAFPRDEIVACCRADDFESKTIARRKCTLKMKARRKCQD